MPELHDTPKDLLIQLHADIHGAKLDGNETELKLIVEILECLIERSDEQRDHGHSIS